MGAQKIARHLSVFLENKPGKLDRITGLLADAGINVRAFSLASAGEYGILKVLVDKPEEACRLLTEAKLTAACKHVLAVGVEDRPGGLHNLLTVLSRHSININDSYGYVMEDKAAALIILELAEEEAAAAALKLEEQGFILYDERALYALP